MEPLGMQPGWVMNPDSTARLCPGSAPGRAGFSAAEAVPEEGTGPGTTPALMPGLGWEFTTGTSPKAASPSFTLPA